MKQASYYLRGTPTGWSMYDLQEVDPGVDQHLEPIAQDLDAKGVVHCIQSQAASNHAADCRVVIGVSASWCLCARVSAEGLPKTNSAQFNQSLAFRLEAELPIAAEDFAIGFIGDTADRLGVAVQAARLQGLVHALEDEGHVVEAITPQALLAAQGWLKGEPLSETDQPISLVWQSEGRASSPQPIQLIHLEPGLPPRWRTIAPSRESVEQSLELDGIDPVSATRRWSATPKLAGLLQQVLQVSASEENAAHQLSEPLDAELQASRLLLDNPQHAWVNLCCGPLAPRYQWRRFRTPALASIAAAMLLLVAAAGVLLLRAHQYDQVASDFDQLADEAFAEALPGQRIPTSPQHRLQNRLKQMRGEFGLASGDEPLTDPTPTLLVLHDVLDALPEEQRFAVTDLRLEDGRLRLSGYARSHGEADQIANALRKSLSFTVEPPSTDNLPEGGVRFTLQAGHIKPDPTPSPENKAPEKQGPPALANRIEEETKP